MMCLSSVYDLLHACNNLIIKSVTLEAKFTFDWELQGLGYFDAAFEVSENASNVDGLDCPIAAVGILHQELPRDFHLILLWVFFLQSLLVERQQTHSRY